MSLSRRSLLRALAAALPTTAGLAIPGHARAGGLEPYRWRNRLLILRVERFDQVTLARQKSLLREDPRGLEDRDLVAFAVTADAVAPIVGAAPDAPPNLRIVRARPQRGFQAVLIGKDGTVKAQWSRPVTLADLFAAIDAMPMRRREME